MGTKAIYLNAALPGHVQLLTSTRAFLGRSSMSVAQTNKDAPANAKPVYRLPVLWTIQPTAYGPANPERFVIELTNAMPEAADTPVRNSPGNDQNGPTRL